MSFFDLGFECVVVDMVSRCVDVDHAVAVFPAMSMVALIETICCYCSTVVYNFFSPLIKLVFWASHNLLMRLDRCRPI